MNRTHSQYTIITTSGNEHESDSVIPMCKIHILKSAKEVMCSDFTRNLAERFDMDGSRIIFCFHIAREDGFFLFFFNFEPISQGIVCGSWWKSGILRGTCIYECVQYDAAWLSLGGGMCMMRKAKGLLLHRVKLNRLKHRVHLDSSQKWQIPTTFQSSSYIKQ